MAQVNALQLHGTGTSLGDPIEMNAALTALTAKSGMDAPLVISAHKASTGHTEPAAGASYQAFSLNTHQHIMDLACAITSGCCCVLPYC